MHQCCRRLHAVQLQITTISMQPHADSLMLCVLQDEAAQARRIAVYDGFAPIQTRKSFRLEDGVQTGATRHVPIQRSSYALWMCTLLTAGHRRATGIPCLHVWWHRLPESTSLTTLAWPNRFSIVRPLRRLVSWSGDTIVSLITFY